MNDETVIAASIVGMLICAGGFYGLWCLAVLFYRCPWCSGRGSSQEVYEGRSTKVTCGICHGWGFHGRYGAPGRNRHGAGYPSTHAGLVTALFESIIGLGSVHMAVLSPGHFGLELRMRWWAWGPFMRARVMPAALRVIREVAPVGTTIDWVEVK